MIKILTYGVPLTVLIVTSLVYGVIVGAISLGLTYLVIYSILKLTPIETNSLKVNHK